MDQQHHRRVEEIFARIADAPPEERPRLLDDLCADDAQLRAEVESLLGYDTPAHTFESPIIRSEELPPPPATSVQPGEMIDGYRITSIIGQGGFGTVYRAEQLEPVRRTVALKIIRPGMDSRSVIARFEAERQALARMDHAGIARVLDAGSTPSGHPYFVMELVDGVPLTTFCDDRSLATEQRLSLFVQVCRAVQHAHLRGIIHRDLKPSNVLVTDIDGQPNPKIIDFGIAKATTEPLIEGTILTQEGQMVGTPAYMPPEQIAMADADIDTRADVYALGAVLYELLTGAPPFDHKSLVARGYESMLSIIREQTPARPSTRMTQNLDELATRRQTDARSLSRRLKGDLDWITLKALEKNRDRRYQSANELADDIERHLRAEPVSAGPPTARYRFGKFARRHKVPIVAACIVAAALIAATTVSSWQAIKAARESARARAFNEFLRAGFERIDPIGDPKERTIFSLLQDAAESMDETLADQPLVRADVHHFLGRAYMRLGMRREAEPHLDEAITLMERVGEGQTDRAWRARVIHGHCLTEMGRQDEGLALIEAAIERYEQGDRDLELEGLLYGNLAAALENSGRTEDAAGAARIAYDAGLELHGPDSTQVAIHQSELAELLVRLAQFEEAEQLSREAIATMDRTVGGGFSQAILTRIVLGQILAQGGQLAESETVLRAAHANAIDALGPSHDWTILAEAELSGVLINSGRHQEAIDVLEPSIANAIEAYGEEDDRVLRSKMNLASAQTYLGHYEPAAETFAAVLPVLQRVRGEDHAETLVAMINLSAVLRRLERPEESIGYSTEAAMRYERSLGPNHPGTLQALNSVAGGLRDSNRTQESITVAEDLCERAVETIPEEHWLMSVFRVTLAQAYIQAERWPDAQPLLEGAYPRFLAALGDGHRHTLRAARLLADVLEAQGFPEQARPWREKAGESAGGG